MSDFRDRYQAVADQQGWTPETEVRVLLDLLNSSALTDAHRDVLAGEVETRGLEEAALSDEQMAELERYAR